jgi:hypothetical protein
MQLPGPNSLSYSLPMLMQVDEIVVGASNIDPCYQAQLWYVIVASYERTIDVRA